MKAVKTYLLAALVGSMLGIGGWAGTASAQSDLELATYYYNTGAFEQARLYLDNLWKKDPSVDDMYLNTLLGLEDFDTAEAQVGCLCLNANCIPHSDSQVIS